MELDKHQWSPNLISSNMAAGGNYPGKLILPGQWLFVIAFRSEVGSYVIFLDEKKCGIVYMLHTWQMLNKNQMFSVSFCAVSTV